jgi:hypothetical protein
MGETILDIHKKSSFEREGRALAELIKRGYTIIINRGTVVVTLNGEVNWAATPSNVMQQIDFNWNRPNERI